MQQSTEDKQRSKNLLWQYAGLATQMLVAIGVTLFIGMQLDKWLKTSMPLLIWILPLVLIISMLVKVIRDTSKKR